MTFKQYVGNRNEYYLVKNLVKIKNIDYVHSSFTNIYSDIGQVDKTVEAKNIFSMFKDLQKLGEELYKIYIKENNEPKIELFGIFLNNDNTLNVSVNNYLIANHNSYSNEIKKKYLEWLEGKNITIEDSEFDYSDLQYSRTKRIIQSDFLIDLSIFVYLVGTAIENKFSYSNKGNVKFKDFVKVNTDKIIDVKDYLFYITLAMDTFKSRNDNFIGEKTRLVYIKGSNCFDFERTFNNYFSVMWYVFELYITWLPLYNNNDDGKYRMCACGNIIFSKSDRCDICRKIYNNNRRQRSRENEEIINEIKNLEKEHIFSAELQSKINQLFEKKSKKKVSWKDTDKIKELKKEMLDEINLQSHVAN